MIDGRFRHADFGKLAVVYEEKPETKIHGKNPPQPRQEMSEQDFFVTDGLVPEKVSNRIGALPQTNERFPTDSWLPHLA